MGEVQVVNCTEILGHQIQVFGDFDNPLFLASDVSKWIEHSKTSMMLQTVDEDEKLKETLFTSGQNREMWFLTEDGLYEVLMQSRKPIAKEFKKKIKTMLKGLRKGELKLQSTKDEEKAQLLLQIYNGGTDGAIAAKRLSEIEVEEATTPLLETIEEKENIIDSVIDDKQLYSVSTVGKVLKSYSSEMGAKKIFTALRKDKILFDRKETQNHNMPYDKYSAYFDVKYVDSDFGTHMKTYFNGKGLKWYLNRLAKKGLINKLDKSKIEEELSI